MNTTPLRAVVAAHAAADVARTPEKATPTVAASAPLIGATNVAPAPFGSAPVLLLMFQSSEFKTPSKEKLLYHY